MARKSAPAPKETPNVSATATASAATAPMSAKERLAAKAAAKKPGGTGKGKKEKPVLTLTDEEQGLLDECLAFGEIEAEAKTMKSGLDGLIKKALRKKVYEVWLKAGHRTENPTVLGKVSSCNFVAADGTSRFNRVPAAPDGSSRTFEQLLLDAGISAKTVAVLKEEVVERDIQTVKSPDHLEADHPKLAEKIRNLILEGLTDEEVELVVGNEAEFHFKEGFVDRLPKFFQTADELEKFVEATKSVSWRLSQVKCHDCSAAWKKINAKIQGEEVPDTSPPKEFITDDKLYKLSVQGKEVTMYRQSDGMAPQLIGVKVCKDSGHALNTTRKMLNSREYLQETEGELSK